ncbi:MAG: ATP-binding cassette domain-containing protein [Paludibacteraceae bacterium]|nr:ATP-binding cassette domain-containing protein [Paludibacteraceae bacterium]
MNFELPMVTINCLNKSFGHQHVLCDISLHIRPGEVVGLLGPNGAGKSTMMKILAGLWRPDSGTVEVPARIGYLPEQNPLYEEMYVREFLRFMSRMTDASRADDIDALIRRVGLAPEAHKRIGQLSKGYRQRVGLAQAMMGDPQLLILDEPTTGLDPNQLDEIRALIRDLGHDRTVLLSTHIMQEVQAMCSRALILANGHIQADTADLTQLDRLFREKTQPLNRPGTDLEQT